MAKERSTKPYLIRAIFEWCVDSGYTPYLSVKVNADTKVPYEYVKNGEIVLNISPDATHRLTIGDDVVQFSARFNGVSRECSIPLPAVTGISARENNQGLFFPPETGDEPAEAAPSAPETEPTPPSGGGKPRLQIVK
jgi:stringent starvation protein B